MSPSPILASPRKPDLRDVLAQALDPREHAIWTKWLEFFLPFQLEWLLDPSRFAICNKSRQIGLSHSSAAACVIWAAILGETTTIISVGQRESDEVLDKAERHANALREMGSKVAKARRSGEALIFNRGGRIIALPASSGGRSFSGNVFLDEYAYLEKPEDVWDSAGAVVMHGKRMRVISTPNGAGNDFYNLWTTPIKTRGWSRHEFPLKRAIAEGMKVSVDDCWKMAKGDPRIFAQLFECSFLDGELQYIPTDHVDAARVPVAMIPRIEGECFAGMDIGLENDLSALTILKADENGVLWEMETLTCKRTAWEDQEAMILQSYHDWGWKRLCVDQTGIGMVPAQRLQRQFGQRVEPYPFTLQSKEVLATGLYESLADRRLVIRDDDDMANDICSLRRIVTTSGNVRYDAPRTDRGHADRAWALALAIHAASPYVKGRPGVRKIADGFESNI